MFKINKYLFILSTKFILINLMIVSIFIVFLNLIEITRILDNNIDKGLITYIHLTFLKLPTILNEIIPFVTIIGISFMLRNLINNNELVSMRNIGYSIFDIFLPIACSVFFIGLIFLFILNPLAANFENKFENIINKKDNSLYSIKVSDNEMWIKNYINSDSSSFINIQNMDLKDVIANNIKILIISDNSSELIQADKGVFKNNYLNLENVKYYDIVNESYDEIDKYKLEINFNKKNILNSITNYKLIPFYNYHIHTTTLKKFNLYTPEIGLYYISELLKPIFIVMLSFVIVGFSGKFKRNENFFKILFISILIGFLIFFFKEVMTKLSISLNINFILCYLIIFLLPFIVGLYQIIKIEND